MSCYHPMVLINTTDMTDPKQRKIAETIKLRYSHEDKKPNKSTTTLVIPREVAEKEGLLLRETNAVLIPCGRCIGCRLDYSREWAIRAVKEAEQYEFNYFLSLTYDDDHLPIGSKGYPTLVKDEVSKFMKRLRKALGLKDIRFFACGEIGTDGSRGMNPHYHIILFNCPIPDLQERHPIPVDGEIKWIKQFDSNGEPLLFSPLIYKCWQERGTAQIGKVTFESCAYVARYIVKKSYGVDAKIYEDLGIEPEYVRMSRRPGIGYQWFMDNMLHIYSFDGFAFRRGDTTIQVKPGKYCDKLLKNKHDQLYYDIKAKRRDDFYDSIDNKSFEAVDVRINNHKAEAVKEQSAKMLKRCL